MELAGQPGQALTFFLTPRVRWDGPLAQKILDVAGEPMREQAKLIIKSPKPGQVYDFPDFGSGFEKLYVGILDEWDDGVLFEERRMVSCYRKVIEKAKSAGLESIVFPALGKDKTDFPHIKFARLAMKGIFSALGDPVQTVTIACADKRMMETYQRRLQE